DPRHDAVRQQHPQRAEDEVGRADAQRTPGARVHGPVVRETPASPMIRTRPRLAARNGEAASPRRWQGRRPAAISTYRPLRAATTPRAGRIYSTSTAVPLTLTMSMLPPWPELIVS